MIALSVAEIATAVGGRIAGADPGAIVSAPLEFDSRKIAPGGLFLALPGEHVDGNDYVAAAVDRGAVAAIVTREVDGPGIVVDDGFVAIAALARVVARRLTRTTIIGVTGSSGKTSTKDLIAQVLGRTGPTVAPPGSFNNELGLPYTVLLADQDTRFLVLEMSARGIGHIRYLTEVAPPRIGVVLNVGSAHLGEFGSREAIAQAKGELVEALPGAADGGVAILNTDDRLVAAMAARTRARIVTVGESRSADVRAEDVALDRSGRASFTLHAAGASVPVELRLVGAHHVGNALAAAAVALECELPLAEVAAALGQATATSRWRMEPIERSDGVLILNDAYNANPESMRAALKTLATIARARRGSGGRSFAVLGPMAELGDAANAEHDALGRLAVRLDISQLVAVGEPARPIQHGAALEGSWDGESRWVPDADAAIALLRRELRAGDVVLVKASRAASLERVALAIAEDAVNTATDGSGGGTA
ncbi:MAG: UDP-N-acetylmuramoyl-tripeptide--D-alanyl-D-alanine ligase [Jatrophihabitantaceae bacterium]